MRPLVNTILTIPPRIATAAVQFRTPNAEDASGIGGLAAHELEPEKGLVDSPNEQPKSNARGMREPSIQYAFLPTT